jgi:hypothetical protein
MAESHRNMTAPSPSTSTRILRALHDSTGDAQSAIDNFGNSGDLGNLCYVARRKIAALQLVILRDRPPSRLRLHARKNGGTAYRDEGKGKMRLS